VEDRPYNEAIKDDLTLSTFSGLICGGGGILGDWACKAVFERRLGAPRNESLETLQQSVLEMASRGLEVVATACVTDACE